MLVTSALHGEGKTEVTAALGLVLSQAMHRTWLVSADMRRPKLHELFDVEQTPGLSRGPRRSPRNGGSRGIFQLSAARTGSGSLHVLASGQTPPDPAQLLASDALDGFFEEVNESEYDYVLLDGPPLLGLVDSQVLAQRVDGVLIVCRPDRQTPETALALRELLDAPRGRIRSAVVIVGREGRDSHLPPRVAGAERGPGPDQGRDEPEVAPVQRVDEGAVGEEAAPGGEQRGGADAVRVDPERDVPRGEAEREEKQAVKTSSAPSTPSSASART